MKNEDEISELQLQALKQSILNVAQTKNHKQKRPYSFKQKLQQKLASKDQNNQIDILQAGQYLKLLCHQKKYLSQKRAIKVFQLNESKQIQQQDYNYLFMVATQSNYLKLQYPNYFQRLIQQIPLYPSNMFSGIQKDIPRTLMSDHPFHSSLRNILIAYSIRNPNLLYCQGMNYVVAYLLINNISQQQTFWILTSIVENMLPDDFYKDLTTISITTQIFSDVLPYYFPDLAKQMKAVGMDSSLFVVSWYVCLFMKGFINSVSAYLFIRLVLESKKHSFGFCLLKLSLGIIATILGRDQPFSFQPDFSSFRDKLQISVFQISLLQIKLGIEYIQLNEQNYLKLQKYYKSRRQKKHSINLQKDLLNKKFTLPKCNISYPICLHRVQIKRKIGQVQQVQIHKNNYPISSQYIEDYFNKENQQKINTTSKCNIYQSINDCLMLRQNHICQCDQQNIPNSIIQLENKILNLKMLRNQESFMESQRKIYNNNNNNSKNLQELQEKQSSNSIQVKSRYSKIDSKFIQLSGYFVIDEEFKFGSEEQVQDLEIDLNIKQTKSGKLIQNKSEWEIFNLEEQLKKNNISQDWIQNQNDFSHHKQQKQNNIPKSLKYLNQEDKNYQKVQKQNQQNKKIEQKTQSWGYQIFNRQNLWNILGKTWKRVLKIKQNQLK